MAGMKRRERHRKRTDGEERWTGLHNIFLFSFIILSLSSPSLFLLFTSHVISFSETWRADMKV